MVSRLSVSPSLITVRVLEGHISCSVVALLVSNMFSGVALAGTCSMIGKSVLVFDWQL